MQQRLVQARAVRDSLPDISSGACVAGQNTPAEICDAGQSTASGMCAAGQPTSSEICASDNLSLEIQMDVCINTKYDVIATC